MKQMILLMTFFLLNSLGIGAQDLGGVRVENLHLERNGAYLKVQMEVHLDSLQVERNRAVLLTPSIVQGDDSLALPSIGLYGRTRYYQYVRGDEGMLSGPDELTYKASEMPQSVAYQTLVEYESWMNHSQLEFVRRDFGCCRTLLAEQGVVFAGYREAVDWLPALAYVRPEAKGEKCFALSGSAFVDFPVDQTVIYPDYRRNEAELGKIQATIDSVRNDRDIHITAVWLKGYASPEGSYAHNTYLARERTAALKRHVCRLYDFDENIIKTEYEPEDWAGLRRYVKASNLEHRTEILALIDSGSEPDGKERRIRVAYPADYRFLLQNCYPALRHTDYRIEYTVRRFSDVGEIKRILLTQPQKLSLDEFYLAAQTCEPGSTEFNEVFETAVRMYPNDPVANLNAANTALQRRDTLAAARYLAKAGQAPEAVYARGVLALLTEDYDEARTLFWQAGQAGVKQAEEALEHLEELMDLHDNSSRNN